MKASQSSVSNGLSTDLHKVVTPGVYTINASSTMDQPSGLIITLSQSGSTSISVSSPTTSPLALTNGVNKAFNCQTGDILSVVVTSSAAKDQPPSLIRTTICLRRGT